MYSQDLKWRACQLYYSRYQSVRKTADALLVGKSSVARWLNDHPVSRKIRSQQKRNQLLVQFIVQQFQQNPFHSLSSLHKTLPDDLKVSRSTLARCVRSTRWTKKCTSKLQLKSRQQNALEEQFLEAMGPLQGTDWVSIDETCIWTDMIPTRGYAPAGKRLFLSTSDKVQISHRKKLSLLVAVTRSGQTYCYLKEGSILSTDFATFLTRMPFPSGTVLVMDNASIHKTKLVKKTLEQKGYCAVFTAPYRPDWNPVEHVFSPFKHHFRMLHKNNLSVEDKIQKVWSMLPEPLWHNCFRTVEARLEDARLIGQL